MLAKHSAAVKPKGLGDYLSIRAALVMRGRSLASFARKYGASRELVRQVISGRCAGKSGVAAKIRADLIAALTNEEKS